MPLLTGLVSHWKLNEAAGNSRADSHGSNTLSESAATVGSATGKIGDAAAFDYEVSGRHLVRTNPASLKPGDTDFTIALWVRISVTPSTIGDGTVMSVINKAGGTDGEYSADFHSSTDRFRFTAYGASGYTSGDVVAANNFGAPPDTNFHLLIVKHDSVNNLLIIKVDNGTADTTAHTSGVFQSSENFHIGSLPDFSQTHKGEIDSVSYWSKLTSDAEDTELWNGGAGLDYESFGGGGGGNDARIVFRKA